MNNNHNEIIGQRINTALALSNVKQKELAKELEIKDNVVSYWCSGKRTPNTEQIIEIADFLNVSADYLLGLSDAATPDKDLQFVCDYTGFNEQAINSLNKRKNYNFSEEYMNFISEFIIKSSDNWEFYSTFCNLYETYPETQKIDEHIDTIQLVNILEKDRYLLDGYIFALSQWFINFIKNNTSYEELSNRINNLYYDDDELNLII